MSSEKPSPPAVTLKDSDIAKMSKNERIKVESDGLFFLAGKDGTHTFLDEVQAMDRGETETIGGEGVKTDVTSRKTPPSFRYRIEGRENSSPPTKRSGSPSSS